MACNEYLNMNNGYEMPSLGIGTWRAPDNEVEEALNLALEAGYRHIDTAPVYMNEKTIGKVLSDWIDSGRVKREDLFIVTKLPLYALRPNNVEKYLKQSLEDLQLTYVDMYLIHVPFGLPESNTTFARDENDLIIMDPETDHFGIWKKMEEMVELGLTRGIGISNFNQNQIQRIIDNSSIKPANLQIELHIFLQQNELVDFCKENDIVVTAYSPLGSKGIEAVYKLFGNEVTLPKLMEVEEVIEIANRLNKTPAQILLKWILQRGIAAIPKSTNPERLRQNLELFDFELSDDDMNILYGLNRDCRLCDFSMFKGIESHPEFPW